MTAAEKSLEPALAALGERYRAQWLFPRLRHIADFVLLDRRLIIEVDGESHNAPEQQRKDILRTVALEALGWAVVRVSNRDALQNPRGVVESLFFLSASRPSVPELQEALAALPPVPPPRPKKSRVGTRPSKRVPGSRAAQPPPASRAS